MTTTHTAQMLDRFDDGSRLTITAQAHNGRVIQVAVAERDRQEAASIWGGGSVPYEFRGGRAFFASRDNE